MTRIRIGPAGKIGDLVISFPSSAFANIVTPKAMTFSGAGEWKRIEATSFGTRLRGGYGLSVSDEGVVTNVSGDQLAVDCVLQVSGSALLNNKLMAIGFGIDGIHVTDWDMPRFIATAGDVGNMGSHTDELILDSGQTVEAMMTNQTDGTSLTAEAMVFSVVERSPVVVFES